MSEPANRAKILLVEDDQLYGLELEKDLVTLGYQVVAEVARTSRVGWEFSQRHQPDLVLLDIHLEEQAAGFWLAEKLLAARIPYLFMTIDNSDQTFVNANKYQPDHYLVKPISPKNLHRSIQLALGRHRINAQLERLVFAGKDRNGATVSLPILDIQLVEAIGNYCYFHVAGQRYSLRASLTKLIKQLPESHFVQIHRRYVVAVAHINSVNLAADLVNIAGAELHIGGKFKQQLEQRLRK